jgi:hypothetical protein
MSPPPRSALRMPAHRMQKVRKISDTLERTRA